MVGDGPVVPSAGACAERPLRAAHEVPRSRHELPRENTMQRLGTCPRLGTARLDGRGGVPRDVMRLARGSPRQADAPCSPMAALLPILSRNPCSSSFRCRRRRSTTAASRRTAS